MGAAWAGAQAAVQQAPAPSANLRRNPPCPRTQGAALTCRRALKPASGGVVVGIKGQRQQAGPRGGPRRRRRPPPALGLLVAQRRGVGLVQQVELQLKPQLHSQAVTLMRPCQHPPQGCRAGRAMGASGRQRAGGGGLALQGGGCWRPRTPPERGQNSQGSPGCFDSVTSAVAWLGIHGSVCAAVTSGTALGLGLFQWGERQAGGAPWQACPPAVHAPLVPLPDSLSRISPTGVQAGSSMQLSPQAGSSQERHRTRSRRRCCATASQLAARG